MDIPITFLSLIENYIVGVLLGVSTLAVVSYGVSLRYGYPRQGVGNALIQSIYVLLRLFHIFFAILVALYIVVFGMFDGITEVQYEYGIKAAVLVINAIIAFGMAQSRKLFPVDYFAPAIGAGWYFLALYHSHSLHIQATSIVGPAVVYVALIGIFQVLFFAMRYFIRPLDKDHGSAKKDTP